MALQIWGLGWPNVFVGWGGWQKVFESGMLKVFYVGTGGKAFLGDEMAKCLGVGWQLVLDNEILMY